MDLSMYHCAQNLQTQLYGLVDKKMQILYKLIYVDSKADIQKKHTKWQETMEKLPNDFKDAHESVKSMYKQTMAAYQEHVLKNPPQKNIAATSFFVDEFVKNLLKHSRMRSEYETAPPYFERDTYVSQKMVIMDVLKQTLSQLPRSQTTAASEYSRHEERQSRINGGGCGYGSDHSDESGGRPYQSKMVWKAASQSAIRRNDSHRSVHKKTTSGGGSRSRSVLKSQQEYHHRPSNNGKDKQHSHSVYAKDNPSRSRPKNNISTTTQSHAPKKEDKTKQIRGGDINSHITAAASSKGRQKSIAKRKHHKNSRFSYVEKVRVPKEHSRVHSTGAGNRQSRKGGGERTNHRQQVFSATDSRIESVTPHDSVSCAIPHPQ